MSPVRAWRAFGLFRRITPRFFDLDGSSRVVNLMVPPFLFY
jgi:hypothetical protein